MSRTDTIRIWDISAVAGRYKNPATFLRPDFETGLLPEYGCFIMNIQQSLLDNAWNTISRMLNNFANVVVVVVNKRSLCPGF